MDLATDRAMNAPDNMPISQVMNLTIDDAGKMRPATRRASNRFFADRKLRFLSVSYCSDALYTQTCGNTQRRDDEGAEEAV